MGHSIFFPLYGTAISSWSKHPATHQGVAHFPRFRWERAFRCQAEGQFSPSMGEGKLAARAGSTLPDEAAQEQKQRLGEEELNTTPT